MSLETEVMSAMKTAMKNKDKEALRGLRAIKSAILLEKTSGSQQELNEAGEIKLLQKLIKQRKESIGIYEEQGRDDLAKTEKEEIEVIQQFLPEQLSEDELKSILKKIIDETGASSMADMGKVMGRATGEVKGRADGKTISAIVKQLLA
ncbi:MAG TPA: GatB/YqeY domain-containing protein [Saprospiraceae bacterium]|nr:GatB/YqeY domain-containing protein [Saprospiraceae bacterium]